jgi:hypothetical protein
MCISHTIICIHTINPKIFFFQITFDKVRWMSVDIKTVCYSTGNIKMGTALTKLPIHLWLRKSNDVCGYIQYTLIFYSNRWRNGELNPINPWTTYKNIKFVWNNKTCTAGMIRRTWMSKTKVYCIYVYVRRKWFIITDKSTLYPTSQVII